MGTSIKTLKGEREMREKISTIVGTFMAFGAAMCIAPLLLILVLKTKIGRSKNVRIRRIRNE